MGRGGAGGNDQGVFAQVMEAASALGSAGFYMPVLLVVFWCVNPGWAARAAVLLTVSTGLNVVLKLFLHAPRPFWGHPGLRGHVSEGSFGMPSGHAQNAVVAWGYAAGVWGLPMIALIGYSRIYLGAHSPGQVLAGWLIGLAVLAASWWRAPVRWWRSRPVPVQVGLAFAASALCWAAARWAVADLSGYRLPAEWSDAIAAAGGHPDPASLTGASLAAGALFGLLAGLSLTAGFDAGGDVWRRLARVPIGLAGAALLWWGTAFLGSYCQAAAVTLWITAAAPWLFVRLDLARPHEP